jgi:hypothetical protein
MQPDLLFNSSDNMSIPGASAEQATPSNIPGNSLPAQDSVKHLKDRLGALKNQAKISMESSSGFAQVPFSQPVSPFATAQFNPAPMPQPAPKPAPEISAIQTANPFLNQPGALTSPVTAPRQTLSQPTFISNVPLPTPASIEPRGTLNNFQQTPPAYPTFETANAANTFNRPPEQPSGQEVMSRKAPLPQTPPIPAPTLAKPPQAVKSVSAQPASQGTQIPDKISTKELEALLHAKARTGLFGKLFANKSDLIPVTGADEVQNLTNRELGVNVPAQF